MSTLIRHKVLFVDDEEEWRHKVSASLADAGFEVLTAADGSETMRQAAGAPVALMIVDEDLAGESGVMLAKFLRYNHPGVPTILYTSTAQDAGTTPDALPQVADQYLPKGSMEELLVNIGWYVT